MEGIYPETWKKARLVLIRKGDKPLDDPSSYRPLCLLDCLAKILRKNLKKPSTWTNGEPRQLAVRISKGPINHRSATLTGKYDKS